MGGRINPEHGGNLGAELTPHDVVQRRRKAGEQAIEFAPLEEALSRVVLRECRDLRRERDPVLLHRKPERAPKELRLTVDRRVRAPGLATPLDVRPNAIRGDERRPRAAEEFAKPLQVSESVIESFDLPVPVVLLERVEKLADRDALLTRPLEVTDSRTVIPNLAAVRRAAFARASRSSFSPTPGSRLTDRFSSARSRR
jgi:hypothetical protein